MSSLNRLTDLNSPMLSRRGAAKKAQSVAAAKAPKERRRWQRLPLPIPIFARGVDGQGKDFLEFTTTLNISAGGTMLVMRRHAAPGAKIQLEIPAAPLPRVALRQPFTRSIRAHVLRVTTSEPAYIWAVHFDEPIHLA